MTLQASDVAPTASGQLAIWRRFQAGLLIIALIGLVVAAWVWQHKARPYHFRTVEQGVLYRSGQLNPTELEGVLERYRIRTVVNLQPESINALPWHARQAAVCEANGASLVDLPMQPETPPTREQQAEWLRLVRDPKRRPILVHCQHGVVRTGMLVSVYFAEKNGRAEGEQAFEDLVRFGHRLEKPKYTAMRAFVTNYQPSLGQ